ncbi:MAG: hypothetical protein COZ69_10685 [Deltaproteobacteria bacterium CG_4_8_14_3_um_filter_45_9]|nr:MAG: hypothetical protein COZ69_10685 [Deltaproteobacteria bacterium CG_4_8_14_3_um_filter_45_9]
MSESQQIRNSNIEIFTLLSNFARSRRLYLSRMYHDTAKQKLLKTYLTGQANLNFKFSNFQNISLNFKFWSFGFVSKFGFCASNFTRINLKS